MITQKSGRTPKLRHHKASGQGYVVLNRRAIYLGRFVDPATEQRYHQLIAEWLVAGKQLQADRTEITVKEIVARFWTHAVAYYVKDNGEPTSEIDNFRSALRPLKQLYAETKAAEFSPLALKAVRQKMIEIGWCRKTVNKHIGRIKAMFRWATENELMPGEMYHALQAVVGLRQGRCDVRESDPVLPVPTAHIHAIKPFVSRPIWAMIQFQLLTAARAGEVVIMRSCDIDTTGRVWTYTPTEHKTAHHGHQRAIYIGPRAQNVLKPFLARPVDTYMFSPAEAEDERRVALHAARKTPLSYGNRPGTNRRHHPRRKPGETYAVAAYRRAISRACDQAFPPPEPLAQHEGETVQAWKARLTPEQKSQLKDWQRKHRWHPHQLRHNAATELRKEFGLETARIVLGHRSAAITEVYAELDQAKAVEAILKVG